MRESLWPKSRNIFIIAVILFILSIVSVGVSSVDAVKVNGTFWVIVIAWVEHNRLEFGLATFGKEGLGRPWLSRGILLAIAFVFVAGYFFDRSLHAAIAMYLMSFSLIFLAFIDRQLM